MVKVTLVLILGLLSISSQVTCMTLNEKEENCVNELLLDRAIIEAWNIEPLVPEDNETLRQFIICYWKKLGYIEENGDLNYVKIGEAVHSDLKSRFQSNCVHIAAYVINNCKNYIINEKDAGLKAIKMWNCLNVQTENVF